MPLSGGYLLDTNILVHLVRRDALGKYLDATYGLTKGTHPFILSLVTIGECFALAGKFGWENAKKTKLNEILGQFEWQDIAQIVAKAWNFAHVLRDVGLSYMAYAEQITFLLFLKMADELTKPPHKRPAVVPAPYDWANLMKREGDELEQFSAIAGKLKG